MKSLAVVDSGVREGLVAVLRERMGADWQVTSEPNGARILLTENTDIGTDLLSQAGSQVALVVKLDTGSATVHAPDIRVIEVPNTALVGVAEHTVAMILASVRRLAYLDSATRARSYLPDRSEPRLTNQKDYTYNWVGLEDFGTIYRRSIGLVGLGYIGRAVAARLRPFGAKLLYYQRTQLSAAEESELGVTYRPLESLLRESSVVSLHHRFQEGEGGNDGQFGRELLSHMRNDAWLVNTARGRLVNEEALAAALQNNELAGAALDVFQYEPLPENHPFFAIPAEKLLLSPHVAGGPVDEAWRLIADTIIEHTAHI